MKLKKNLKLFGLDDHINELISLYKNKKFPNKIILSGKRGIGKTTLSYHLINYILSENENLKYDPNDKSINILNKSYQLVNNNIHPNFYKISLMNDKKNIDIDQIRQMSSFINKSSFNNSNKIVLIENIELLNKFSCNALLKSVEEPNIDVLFILILNNEHTILDTIKSRCIEYKLNLKNEYIKNIVNFYFNDEIFDKISNDFKNYYTSPSSLINFVIFCNEENLNYEKISVEKLLKYYFKSNLFKKPNNISGDIKFYLELFFHEKLSKIKNNDVIDLYSYFNKRFNLINTFNLDMETFYIEFKSKVFNE